MKKLIDIEPDVKNRLELMAKESGHKLKKYIEILLTKHAKHHENTLEEIKR
jgi:hypothetical protein